MDIEKTFLKQFFEEMELELFKLKEKNSNLRVIKEENELFASIEERHGSKSKPVELRMRLEEKTIKVCLLGNGFVQDEFRDFTDAYNLFINTEKTLFKDQDV